MKCLVCNSTNTKWVETILHHIDGGYEAYACKDCRSRTEYGIVVFRLVYTGRNDVIPFEEE